MGKSGTNDKMTRDIRDSLRKSAKVGGRYFTGTAKLFLASTAEIAKSTVPTVGAMLETNADLIRDVKTFLKSPSDAIHSAVDTAMATETYGAMKKFATNALEDLKTGNLYDPNRDRTGFGADTEALLDNFGDFDMNGFDDDGLYDMEESQDFEHDEKMLESHEQAQDTRTTATINAVQQSAQATIANANVNATTNIRMGIKQHAQTMAGVQNLVTQQAAMLQTMNEGITSMLEVSRAAHQEVMEGMNNITDILLEIRDNTAKYVDEDEEEVEGPQIFGPNGSVDVRAWLTTAAKQSAEKYGVSNMLNMVGGMDPKTLLEAVGDNPWQLVTDQIVKKVLPNYLKQTMDMTREHLENFMPSLLAKFSDMGKQFDKDIASGGKARKRDFIAGLFGVEPQRGGYLDLTPQNVGEASFITKRTVQAIEQVIPMWLSKIYSAVSGAELSMYNYSTGMIDSVAQRVADTSNEIGNLVTNMGSSAREIERRALDGSVFQWEDPKMKEQFEDYLFQYLQQNAKNGTFINPWQDKKFEEELPEHEYKDVFGRVLKSVMQNMPRSELMALNQEVHNSRNTQRSRNIQTAKEIRESGQDIVFEMLPEDLRNRMEREGMRKKWGITEEDREKIITDYNKTSREAGRKIGMAGTNEYLEDITSMLRKGIVTYTHIVDTAKGGRRGIRFGRRGDSPLDAIYADVSRTAEKENDRLQAIREDQEFWEQYEREDREESIKKAREKQISDRSGKVWITKDTSQSLLNMAQANYIIDRTKADESGSEDVEEWRRSRMLGAANEMDENYAETKANAGAVSSMFKNNISQHAYGLKNAITGNKGGNKITQAKDVPFKLVDLGLRTVDQFLFKILYGEDAAAIPADEKDEDAISLMNVVTKSVQAQWKNATDWFSENIGKPMKEFFLGENGLLTGIKDRLVNIFQDKVVGTFTNIKDKTKERLAGTKNADGTWSGGIFSDAINRAGNLQGGISQGIGEKFTSAKNRFLYGSDDPDSKGMLFKGKRENFIDDTSYVKKRKDRKTGKMIYTYRNSDGTLEEGDLRQIAQHEYYGAVGMFKKGFDNLKETLFGPERGEDVNGSKAKFEMVSDEMKKAFPDMTIGAGVGLIGSLFLPGGPILGMLMGSFGGLAASSEKFNEYLFGKKTTKTVRKYNMSTGTFEDKEVESRDESGIFSSQLTDGIKQYAPKMAGGALIGKIAGGAIMPGLFGPAIGMVLGSVTGMIASSDKLKALIFGDTEKGEDDGLISKKMRDNIVNAVKAHAPGIFGGGLAGAKLGSMLGAGLGLIPGLALLPTGPIFTLLGGITGAIGGDTIQEMFFGKFEDVEETDPNDPTKTRHVKKRVGGLFGSAFDYTRDHIFAPFGEKISKMGESVSNWFDESVIGPLKRSMEPVKESMEGAKNAIQGAFMRMGESIQKSLDKVFTESFGKPLGEWFDEKVLKPLNKMTDKIFGTIGKAIGAILSAPFKAIEFIFTGKIGETAGEKRKRLKSEAKEERRLEKARRVRDAKIAGQEKMDKFKSMFSSLLGRDGLDATPLKDKAKHKRGLFLGGKFKEEGLKGEDANERAKRRRSLFGSTMGGENIGTASDGKGKRKGFLGLGGGDGSIRGADVDGKKYGRHYVKNEKNPKFETPDASLKSRRDRSSATSPDIKSAEKGTGITSDNKDVKAGSAKGFRVVGDAISSIERTVSKIYSEIKGQLGGVGWNVAYIQRLLQKRHGRLKSSDLPDNMEGSTKRVTKRKGLIGRAVGGVTGTVGGLIGGAVNILLSPLKLLGNVITGVGAALGGLTKGVLSLTGSLINVAGTIGGALLKGASKALGGIIAGSAKMIGGVLGGAAKMIGGAASGLGKVLGNTLAMLSGVTKDVVLALSGLTTGLVRTIAQIAPDIVSGVIKGLGVVGKTLAKGVFGAIKLGAKGISWAFGKVFGGIGHLLGGLFGGGKKTKNTYKLSGSDSIPVSVGGTGHPVDYPYVSVSNGLATYYSSDKAIPVYLVGAAKEAVVYIRKAKKSSKHDEDPDEKMQKDLENLYTLGSQAGSIYTHDQGLHLKIDEVIRLMGGKPPVFVGHEGNVPSNGAAGSTKAKKQPEKTDKTAPANPTAKISPPNVPESPKTESTIAGNKSAEPDIENTDLSLGGDGVYRKYGGWNKIDKKAVESAETNKATGYKLHPTWKLPFGKKESAKTDYANITKYKNQPGWEPVGGMDTKGTNVAVKTKYQEQGTWKLNGDPTVNPSMKPELVDGHMYRTYGGWSPIGQTKPKPPEKPKSSVIPNPVKGIKDQADKAKADKEKKEAEKKILDTSENAKDEETKKRTSIFGRVGGFLNKINPFAKKGKGNDPASAPTTDGKLTFKGASLLVYVTGMSKGVMEGMSGRTSGLREESDMTLTERFKTRKRRKQERETFDNYYSADRKIYNPLSWNRGSRMKPSVVDIPRMKFKGSGLIVHLGSMESALLKILSGGKYKERDKEKRRGLGGLKDRFDEKVQGFKNFFKPSDEYDEAGDKYRNKWIGGRLIDKIRGKKRERGDLIEATPNAQAVTIQGVGTYNNSLMVHVTGMDQQVYLTLLGKVEPDGRQNPGDPKPDDEQGGDDDNPPPKKKPLLIRFLEKMLAPILLPFKMISKVFKTGKKIVGGIKDFFFGGTNEDGSRRASGARRLVGKIGRGVRNAVGTVDDWKNWAGGLFGRRRPTGDGSSDPGSDSANGGGQSGPSILSRIRGAAGTVRNTGRKVRSMFNRVKSSGDGDPDPGSQRANGGNQPNDSNSLRNRLKSWKSGFFSSIRKAKRAKDPSRAYEDGFKGASSMEEIEGIKAAQAGEGGGFGEPTKEKKEGILSKLLKWVPIILPFITKIFGGLFGGVKGLLGGLFSGGGLLGTINKLIGGTKIGKFFGGNMVASLATSMVANKINKEYGNAGWVTNAGIRNKAGMVKDMFTGLDALRGGVGVDDLTGQQKMLGGIADSFLKGAAGQTDDIAKGFLNKGASKVGKLAGKVGNLASRAGGFAKKAAMSSVDDVAKMSGIKGAIAKVINGICNNGVVKKMCGKLAPKLQKVGQSLIDFITQKCGPIVMKEAGEASLKGTAKTIAAFLSGPYGAAAFAIVDFISGFNNAYKYFGVAGSDVSLAMKLTSAIVNTLGGALSMIFPPIGPLLSMAVGLVQDKIVQLVYGIFADDAAKAELKQSQEELKAATASYNQANGTDLTTEEYSKKFNNDGTERKGIFTKIKDFFTGGDKDSKTIDPQAASANTAKTEENTSKANVKIEVTETDDTGKGTGDPQLDGYGKISTKVGDYAKGLSKSMGKVMPGASESEYGKGIFNFGTDKVNSDFMTAVTEMMQNLALSLEQVRTEKSSVVDWVKNGASGLKDAAGNLLSNLPSFSDTAGKAGSALYTGKTALQDHFDSLKKTVTSNDDFKAFIEGATDTIDDAKKSFAKNDTVKDLKKQGAKFKQDLSKSVAKTLVQNPELMRAYGTVRNTKNDLLKGFKKTTKGIGNALDDFANDYIPDELLSAKKKFTRTLQGKSAESIFDKMSNTLDDLADAINPNRPSKKRNLLEDIGNSIKTTAGDVSTAVSNIDFSGEPEDVLASIAEQGDNLLHPTLGSKLKAWYNGKKRDYKIGQTKKKATKWITGQKSELEELMDEAGITDAYSTAKAKVSGLLSNEKLQSLKGSAQSTFNQLTNGAKSAWGSVTDTAKYELGMIKKTINPGPGKKTVTSAGSFDEDGWRQRTIENGHLISEHRNDKTGEIDMTIDHTMFKESYQDQKTSWKSGVQETAEDILSKAKDLKDSASNKLFNLLARDNPNSKPVVTLNAGWDELGWRIATDASNRQVLQHRNPETGEIDNTIYQDELDERYAKQKRDARDADISNFFSPITNLADKASTGLKNLKGWHLDPAVKEAAEDTLNKFRGWYLDPEIKESVSKGLNSLQGWYLDPEVKDALKNAKSDATTTLESILTKDQKAQLATRWANIKTTASNKFKLAESYGEEFVNSLNLSPDESVSNSTSGLIAMGKEAGSSLVNTITTKLGGKTGINGAFESVGVGIGKAIAEVENTLPSTDQLSTAVGEVKGKASNLINSIRQAGADAYAEMTAPKVKKGPQITVSSVGFGYGPGLDDYGLYGTGFATNLSRNVKNGMQYAKSFANENLTQENIDRMLAVGQGIGQTVMKQVKDSLPNKRDVAQVFDRIGTGVGDMFVADVRNEDGNTTTVGDKVAKSLSEGLEIVLNGNVGVKPDDNSSFASKITNAFKSIWNKLGSTTITIFQKIKEFLGIDDNDNPNDATPEDTTPQDKEKPSLATTEGVRVIESSLNTSIDKVLGADRKRKEQIHNIVVKTGTVTNIPEAVILAGGNGPLSQAGAAEAQLNGTLVLPESYLKQIQENGENWGTGRVHAMSQSDSRWTKSDKNMAKVGCGPTVASMVGSAYGDKTTPAQANKMSFGMGMRASDGGTNPKFFSKFAAGKNYGMKEGSPDSGAISSNLRKGQPVVMMGKGGSYGSNMHYLVADKMTGKNKASVVDPIGGARKNVSLQDLSGNAKTAVYSYGKGPGRYGTGNNIALELTETAAEAGLNVASNKLTESDSIDITANAANNTISAGKFVHDSVKAANNPLLHFGREATATQKIVAGAYYSAKNALGVGRVGDDVLNGTPKIIKKAMDVIFGNTVVKTLFGGAIAKIQPVVNGIISFIKTTVLPSVISSSSAATLKSVGKKIVNFVTGNVMTYLLAIKDFYKGFTGAATYFPDAKKITFGMKLTAGAVSAAITLVNILVPPFGSAVSLGMSLYKSQLITTVYEIVKNVTETGKEVIATAKQKLDELESGKGSGGVYYDFGKGPSDEVTDAGYVTPDDSRTQASNKRAQQSLVNKMASIIDTLDYSTKRAQDPDKGVASCASTVAWAYDKVLGFKPGGAGMARSSLQSQDKRFTTIYEKTSPNQRLDLSILQPGDIVYQNNGDDMSYDTMTFADVIRRKGRDSALGHTEMAVGDGKRSLSHGGAGNDDKGVYHAKGPYYKPLNSDFRRRRTFLVRRYTPFLNGTEVTYTDVASRGGTFGDSGYSGGGFNADGTSSDGTTSNGIFGKVGQVYSQYLEPLKDIFTAAGNVFKTFIGYITGDAPDEGGTEPSTEDMPANGTVADNAGTPGGYVEGNADTEKIWNYLRSKGVTKAGAAGLMGNLQAESSLKAFNVEDKSYNKALYKKNPRLEDEAYFNDIYSGKTSFVPSLKGNSPGWGLAQWTYGSRKQGLWDLAKSRGKKVDDLNTQLDYLWNELNSMKKEDASGKRKSLASILAKTNNLTEASNLILWDFEGPRTGNGKDYPTEAQHEAKRYGYSKSWYDKYANKELARNTSLSNDPTMVPDNVIRPSLSDDPTVAVATTKTPSLSDDPTMGAGPGGVSYNLQSLNDMVSNLNAMMTKTREDAANESTVTTLTNEITRAINTSHDAGGNSNDQMMAAIAQGLAQMVQLLTKIEQNTSGSNRTPERAPGRTYAADAGKTRHIQTEVPPYPNRPDEPIRIGQNVVRNMVSNYR